MWTRQVGEGQREEAPLISSPQGLASHTTRIHACQHTHTISRPVFCFLIVPPRPLLTALLPPPPLPRGPATMSRAPQSPRPGTDGSGSSQSFPTFSSHLRGHLFKEAVPRDLPDFQFHPKPTLRQEHGAGSLWGMCPPGYGAHVCSVCVFPLSALTR